MQMQTHAKSAETRFAPRGHYERFGALTANDDISYHRKGEVHVRFGKTGRGKARWPILYTVQAPMPLHLFKRRRKRQNPFAPDAAALTRMVHRISLLVPCFPPSRIYCGP